MDAQSQLDGSLVDIDKAVVYYRTVSSEKTIVSPEKEELTTTSQLNDIEKLITNIKSRKLKYPTSLRQSEMGEVPATKVTQIFSDEDIENHTPLLLGLFCDRLEGRQRSDNKYAMLIYTDEKFLLAHVRAERGMSINEQSNDVETIRRFLDIDNILSAALFEERESKIEFTHFTDSGSAAFKNFIGVQNRELNYRRKKIQLLAYYRGRRSLTCKFEFSVDEFQDKWMRDSDIDMSGNKLEINSDVQNGRSHEIKEIRWGNDSYTSVNRFKSEFRESIHNLSVERDKYDSLKSMPSDDSSQHSVYKSDRAIDHRREVRLIDVDEGDKSVNVVSKEKTPDDLYVIFASSNIELDPEFATDIFRDIQNGNRVRIFHPSEPPAAKSLSIGNIEFLNLDPSEIPDRPIEFLNATYDHLTNRAGNTVRKCLLNSLLAVIKEYSNPPMKEAISQIVDIYAGNPQDGDPVSTKENEGPNVIEFKNAKHLEKENPDEHIADLIETEVNKGARMKVVMWGFTEQTREINGLDTQSWGDDRITDVEKHTRSELEDRGVEFDRFMMQPIELGNTGRKLAVTGVFY